MFRVRAASFCAGFAVAAAGSMYMLQRDVWASHQSLANQAEGYHAELEGRIARLEGITSGSSSPPPKSEAPHQEPKPVSESS